MSTLASAVLDLSVPRDRRINIDQYNWMIEMGVLAHRRCELIDGELTDMASIGIAHSIALQDFYDLLRALFPNPCFIKTQATHRIGDYYAPEPDVVLHLSRPRPGARLDIEAALVVEISDSTLRYDLSKKKLVYARHGIADYWVVNLHARHIHVFRGPRTDATEHADAYESETIVGLDGLVAPLVDPTKQIRVGGFMPLAGAEPDLT